MRGTSLPIASEITNASDPIRKSNELATRTKPKRPGSQISDGGQRKLRKYQIDHHFHTFQTCQCNEVDDKRDGAEQARAPAKRKEQADDKTKRQYLGEWRENLR